MGRHLNTLGMLVKGKLQLFEAAREKEMHLDEEP
jgi:hypothetical protein